MKVKQIIFKLVKSLVTIGINYLYNFIDKNDDGKLDKNELGEFAALISSRAKRFRNKSR